MNQLINLQKLETASFFDKTTLQQVVKISDNSLYSNIKRWIEKGDLIQLKKGLYVTNAYYQKVANKQDYLEFMANNLKYPSYLSLEYVLQKYSILSESVFSLTSISRKKTKIYSNKLGVFSYSSIKNDLFTGFSVVYKSGFKIRQASKAKALFDYFYLKSRSILKFDKDLLASFRLNLDEFGKADFVELDSFVKLAGSGNLRNIVKLLKQVKNDS